MELILKDVQKIQTKIKSGVWLSGLILIANKPKRSVNQVSSTRRSLSIIITHLSFLQGFHEVGFLLVFVVCVASVQAWFLVSPPGC
jgi:hypothetical protein